MRWGMNEMRDKSLIAKVEETIESLEESAFSLEQLKKDIPNYREFKVANTYIQRAKRVLDFLYNRLIKNNKV